MDRLEPTDAPSAKASCRLDLTPLNAPITGKARGLTAVFPLPTILATALASLALALLTPSSARADESLANEASWHAVSTEDMAILLRSALDQLGITPDAMDKAAEDFLIAIESRDEDPLDAYVVATRGRVSVIDEVVSQTKTSMATAGMTVDPNSETYAEIESLPKSMRMTLRTWLGRELVRARLFDEALPVIAEVDPSESLDPAATLFYRGACYHALLMKKEALADLRRLLENEDDSPVRFTRTARMMVADIKPLKEDTLDEISRLMTDVTRRLDLGRSDEQTTDQEQKIIDKLTKLIDDLEKQQQQQQQQQKSGGKPSNGKGGQGSPMEDSQIAGGSGNGDVDKKNIEDRDGWGNLPPAERQQALQQISRDLPTHYREAIEAYFRKLATEG